ncbi:6-phospho-beta-glucosidase [Psychromicrobium xiongbiense]|uniref:family 4 glycosyl hydrolase n=1 Tax=Psychromicrobium xiongbiense TaxID=3051184 RepID=UPI002557B2B2|nr:6-phospho-beta-glucosidase [Psychromicrobium sp. YIM S02556]
MRLTIVGGGGFRVPLVYRALSMGRQAGLIDSVMLHDVEESRLHGIRAVLESMPFQGPGIEVSTSLETALDAADVVFAATRVGGAAGRVHDERVALDLGVLGQETTGAGGISYALRSIPYMLHLARTMQERCPSAWLVNFTNPAGMVTQALHPVLGHRVIGICDSPIGLVRRAARAANFELRGLAGVDYMGLNHLGWLRALRQPVPGQGEVDLLPALLDSPARLETFEEGRLFGAEFLHRLGSLPNEYLFYYYRHWEALNAIRSVEQTRGESIAQAQDLLYPTLEGPQAFDRWDRARRAREEGYLAEARGQSEERDEADLVGGGYEEVALAAMKALLTESGTGPRGPGQGSTELILNVRNGTTLADFAEDAVIEVPSRVDSSGAHPLPLDAPTGSQLDLMRQIKAVETAVVRAATYGERDQALLAFSLHPLVADADLAARLLSGYEAAFPALLDLWA